MEKETTIFVDHFCSKKVWVEVMEGVHTTPGFFFFFFFIGLVCMPSQQITCDRLMRFVSMFVLVNGINI